MKRPGIRRTLGLVAAYFAIGALMPAAASSFLSRKSGTVSGVVGARTSSAFLMLRVR
jgi:hypothetical protein